MSTTYTLSGSIAALVGEPFAGTSRIPGVRGRVEAYGSKAHVGTTDTEAAQVRVGSYPLTINVITGDWTVTLPATGEAMGWSPAYQAYRVVIEWTDPGTGESQSWASPDPFTLTANSTMADVATWVETQIQTAEYWATIAENAAQNFSIEIGTVTTGATGDPADATITGDPGDLLLNLTLPKGDKGDTGADGSITSVNGDAGPVVVLTQDEVGDGVSFVRFSTADSTKLDGIATGATANDTDAALRDRSTHTGTQTLATISDAGTAAAADTTAFATAAQGATADTAVQPGDLATVATSGSYTDLSATPTLGTAASKADTDFALSTAGGREKVAAFSGTSGTITADLANASVFTVVPTGNITLAFSNVPTSPYAATVTVHVLQDATPRTITMPGGTTWYAPGEPTQAANKTCTITLHTANGGTNWYAAGAVMA